MKVKIIAAVGFLVMSVLAIVVIVPQIVASTDICSPEDMVYEYLQRLKSHQWDEAYNMTSYQFQEKIPVEAFSHDLESSGFADNLVYFNIGNTVAEDNEAEVEIDFTYLNPGAKVPTQGSSSFSLTKEQEGWRINLPWEDFLAAKLDTQAPLAVSQKNGVSVSIQYILLYPETQLTAGRSRIRLDIKNESNHTLRWEFPISGERESYIKNLNTGEMYLPVSGSGAMGKKAEAFYINFEEGPPLVLTAAPGTQGSVFIYVESIPVTVKQFDMVLDGFSFPEVDGESWDITFSSVPLYFDVAPTG